MKQLNSFLLLTLMGLLGSLNVMGQNKPYPQGLTYPGCIKPNNITQTTLNNDALTYYNYWKGKYLKQSSANASHYYIEAGSTGGSNSAVTQSEAHGYGMVITALMAGADANAKTYYDGLYRMYDTHRSANNNNLMQWQVFADEHNANLGSATDGDMDIAYSLLLAHYQWGSTGAINYLDAAQKMITNGLKASYIYSTLRLGLADEPTNDHLSTRPSDWMFDHMRAFKAHTNDGIWDQLAVNLYNVYSQIYANNSSTTGLISDFVMYDPPKPAPPKQPQADEGNTTGDYSYNACRIPLRLVMDFAHYGTTSPKPYLSKMVSWARSTTSEDPTKFQAGYKLNGSPLSGANYQSACFISPMVAASVIDANNQKWLNDGWAYMKGSKDSYYEDTYNMLCMLFVSGNWWVPSGSNPNNQAPTVSLSSPSNNATFTAPASISIAANASDADGTISKVEFYNGSTFLNSDATAPYTYAWSGVGTGTYTITAKATDNAGATTTSSSVTVTVNSVVVTQSPYGGAPAAIPGTVEAAKYDLGGQNIAYYDNTTGNSGSTFRADDVDVEASTEGGYNLGWTAASEWTEYTVNVTAGTYKIEARVAATTAGKSFRIEMDGSTVATFSVPNTSGWQTWQTVTVNNVSLSGGQKIMRLFNITDGFNVSTLKFTIASTVNQSPSVSLTAPINNATFTAPASISIAANASDVDGTISKVEFYNGNTLLNSDATAPYIYTWTGVNAGTFTITAKATDNAGAVTTSTAATITVNPVTTGDTEAPNITLTAPTNNTSVNAPANISITANAADNVGVAKVEFYNGTTLLGTDNSSPYVYSWTNVAAGTYSISAKAYDAAGNSATSQAAILTVNTVTTGGCSGIAQYTENNGYVAGSKVQNAGSQYQCKPYPYSGWCNGAAWAYGPGTGAYWSDAWTLVGSCNARSAADGSNNTSAIVNENMLSNSPNPFQENTTIEVTLNEESDVNIAVYNKAGQIVATVLEGHLNSGTHALQFDSKALMPGLYIVKCSTNNNVITRKIVKN